MAVTVENVAVALGRETPGASSAEYKQWTMWINDAVMLIEAKRLAVKPDLVLGQIALDYVVREAVVAQVKKPMMRLR